MRLFSTAVLPLFIRAVPSHQSITSAISDSFTYTTYTFTSVLRASQTRTFGLNDINNGPNEYTAVGPTTFLGTYVNFVGGTVFTLPLPRTFTTSYTLALGTQVLKVVNYGVTSEVSLTGPTTYIATLTSGWDQVGGIYAGFDSADPHCTQSQSLGLLRAGQLVTYAQSWAELTAGQTLTDFVPQGVRTDGVPPHMVYVTWTAPKTAPTTVSLTLTEQIPFHNDGQSLVGEAGQIPGAACGGRCGFCQLYFPTVYVYYWPVPSPNTACLSSSEGGSTTAKSKSSTGSIKPRPLTKNRTNTSMIVSKGFTFISPSVYLAFPTISALDDCGTLGRVHTSTTLAFAPGQLTTLDDYFGTNSSIFSFADALCPPTSLSGKQTISIIGASGYNPILSPPAELTLIDPAWNANCYAAYFQGNDPPYALTPASALVTSPTGAELFVAATRADPGPKVASLPAQTTFATVFNPRPALPSLLDPAFASSTKVADPPNRPPDPPQASVTTPNNFASKPPITTLVGHLFTPDPSSNFVIGTEVLTPGGIITVSSTPISLSAAGGLAIIGGETQILTQPHPIPVLVFDTQTLTINSASAFVMGSQTLVPGSVVTVSGTAYSVPLATPGPAVMTFGGTYIANSASAFILASQTLGPGGVITISGTPLSLPISAVYYLEGTSKIPLATAAPKVLTYGGQVYTANSASDFVIAGQTLVPGSVITVSGTQISVAVTPTDLVIGSSTQGLGGLILSGIGGASPTGVAFKGEAKKVGIGVRWMLGMCLVVGLAGVRIAL